MIWNQKIECMSRDEMRELQSEKLKKIVAHAYNNSPFYKKRFDEHGVRPEDIKMYDKIRDKMEGLNRENAIKKIGFV